MLRVGAGGHPLGPVAVATRLLGLLLDMLILAILLVADAFLVPLLSGHDSVLLSVCSSCLVCSTGKMPIEALRQIPSRPRAFHVPTSIIQS
jgi:hypothetical protein